MIAVLFDTETTDIVTNNILRDEHQPRVIELYACLTDDSEAILDEIEFRCDPGVQVTPEITKITGIKEEDVKGLPPFSSHIPRLAEIFGKGEAMVAHNLSFDWTIMRLELGRAGVEGFPFPSLPICTVEQTEWIKGFRLNLTGLYEYLFGMTFEGAHRAKNDVMAMKRCYHELRRRGEI